MQLSKTLTGIVSVTAVTTALLFSTNSHADPSGWDRAPIRGNVSNIIITDEGTKVAAPSGGRAWSEVGSHNSSRSNKDKLAQNAAKPRAPKANTARSIRYLLYP